MDSRIQLISFVLLSAFLVGCAGAPRTTVIAKDETTSILLVGDLVGGTVELSNGFRHTISKEDLQKSIANISSVKDSPDQKLDRVLLTVDPGEIEVKFMRRDGKLIKRRLFLVPGITNEVRLN